jgi:hypothetical protein
MRLSERIRPADEEGTTMVELLVGMAMGMVVITGLAILLIVTLRGNARVDARIEATDNGRLAMARIIEELHSACVKPSTAPIKETSTGYKLVFSHGTYGKAADPNLEGTTSAISYVVKNGVGTLVQTDLSPAGVEEPPRTLVSNVGPYKAAAPIFTYYKYEVKDAASERNPTLIGLATNETAIGLEAAYTTLVYVKFKASPKSEPVADTGASATIESGATLRLTPAALTGGASLPCR